ncbi:SGNH/GDSL hydrolase family protein [Nocardia sp. CDC160]|uniref:SGNH/GDSL hydrolase family protein n=1 Tax=Nocardia sp. CDC160 TaxID=3112166 RepID=UPI002DB90D95|nr:SGNH/GDSL hydrolase family protein [Nocardia sp. CDC160]MEC3915793.1 SGNH/GDSL hydrolase family protein [Nocardia sp. CDC160]
MTVTEQPLTEETDPDVLAPQLAAALLHDAPWRRFASFGDSLSAGVCGPTPGYEHLGWVGRVERVLRMVYPDLAYLNTSKVGATTAQALAEQRQLIEDFEPDLLHVNSGANDIVRRHPDWDQIEAGLREMWVWAAGTGAQLTVFTLVRRFVIPAFPDWTDRVARLNDITRKLAGEFDAVLVDTWDHPINERANLVSEDKIHVASGGQAVLATLMVKELAYRL